MSNHLSSAIRPAIVMTVLFGGLLGIVYPLAITGVAQVALPSQANGSLVRDGDKVVGSSLQVEVGVPVDDPADLAELFITGPVHRADSLTVAKTDLLKCGRCWRHLPEVAEDGALCDRCEGVVNG